MAFTTIDDPSAYFKVQLYTGDGSTQAITFDDTDTDMQPDLVWLKDRATSEASHKLYDAVRGTTKYLAANNTGAEGTESGVTAFGSDGFTLGSAAGTNANTVAFVSFCWKESATAGFDIVGYTGNGSARTISHSLSAVPHLMILKIRDDTGYNWRVYHHKNTSAPETDYLALNTTAATADSATMWNDTAPTSSVFSLGTSGSLNQNTSTFIAYLFSEKQGYSKFGSYEGNGNADGPFIYTGFPVAWIVFKNTSATTDWYIYDVKRRTYNPMNTFVKAQTNQPDSTSGVNIFDICSNGIKIRGDGSVINTDGNTYVYAAFAEAPFVNSKGVPCNAK
jgi:hypothetical protein